MGAAVLLGIILLGAGCTFDEPMNPSWNVNLVIPLAEQRYSVYDLKDSAGGPDSGYGIGFRDEEDSLLFFFYYDTFDTTTLGDSLYVPPQHDSVSSGLESAYFDPGIDDSTGFSLGQIYPEIAPYNGQTVPVPAFTFGPTEKDLAPLQNLEYVIVDSGWFHYTIINNLPVPIDSIHFRFFSTNNPSNIVVDNYLPGRIPPGQVFHDSSDLHNKRIDQLLTVEFTGHSPGSTTPVLVDTSASVIMEAQVGRLRAREAHGFFPRQSISVDSFVVWETEHMIRSLGIDRGQAHVIGYNETEAHATVTLLFKNFTNESGDTLEDIFYIPPQDTVHHTLELDGYTLVIPDPPSRRIEVFSTAVFDSTSQWIHYTADQEVFATLDLDTTYLSFIDGIIEPVQMSIGPDEQEVEQIPEGWEQLTIAGATLSLRLNSDISTAIETDFYLYAQHNGVNVDSVRIEETITPNQDTLIVIEGLERLINARPDMIVISGTASVGGDVYLAASNFVEGELQVDIPLSFALEATTIEGRLETIEDVIDEDVNGATVQATIHNHLPMSGRVLVLAADDSMLFTVNPELADTLVDAVIPQPITANGRVQEEAEAEILLKLTQEKIDRFRTAPTYIQPYFYLDGTGGDTLSVYGRDYLGFSAIATFVFEIDTD
jgi:hypothetical protein